MNIKEIDELTVKDTYSLIMFALYKLKDDPKYSTLSELCYLIDRENLFKLLEYFGGLTITIPTYDELKNLVNALYLYNYVDLEKSADLNKTLKRLENNFSDKAEVLQAYAKIHELLDKYHFGDREDHVQE